MSAVKLGLCGLLHLNETNNKGVHCTSNIKKRKYKIISVKFMVAVLWQPGWRVQVQVAVSKSYNNFSQSKWIWSTAETRPCLWSELKLSDETMSVRDWEMH